MMGLWMLRRVAVKDVLLIGLGFFNISSVTAGTYSSGVCIIGALAKDAEVTL